MPQTIYCWRCKMDVPMLTEEEWQFIDPISMFEQIKRYREETGCSLAEAYRNKAGYHALAAYESLTGFPETSPLALMHHRLKLLGPLCHICGKPLRTPMANFCAECGTSRSV
jgi:hypothetical protein